ncbi:MAG: putative flavin-nucleotide-binding protein [Firmicutes bacterium]|nr:putative flavin-nucleotide-binding protein [Bacillota bacterium]
MFREMRRSDRQCTKDQAITILEKCEYGVLSTVSQDGYPYGVPLSYVFKDSQVYFHSATTGHKLEHIESNPKVSFCVVGDKQTLPEKFSTSYESVIVFGQASEVVGEEKKAALLELVAKYSPDYLEKGKQYIENSGDKTTVIKITVEQITGKVRPQ